jgi:small subunit ribosomal protein S8e
MSIWHGDLHKKKKTGGRGKSYRGKRAFEAGGPPAETKVGNIVSVKIVRTKGGGKKVKLLSTNFANVYNPKTKKTLKVEVLKVIKNPASLDYDKRGIITKGTVIDTPLGKAVVTSRPGQDGVVNARLMEKVEVKR